MSATEYLAKSDGGDSGNDMAPLPSPLTSPYYMDPITIADSYHGIVAIAFYGMNAKTVDITRQDDGSTTTVDNSNNKGTIIGLALKSGTYQITVNDGATYSSSKPVNQESSYLHATPTGTAITHLGTSYIIYDKTSMEAVSITIVVQVGTGPTLPDPPMTVTRATSR